MSRALLNESKVISISWHVKLDAWHSRNRGGNNRNNNQFARESEEVASIKRRRRQS